MEHLSRKERRKLERSEQLEQYYTLASSSNRKELIIVLSTLGLLLAIFIFGFWYYNTPQLGEHYDDLGREHIAEDDQHEAYNSNPPTSGPHYVEAANWSVYAEELPDETLIHNIEHGGIWISYKDLSENEIKQLSSLANKYPQRVVMAPRIKNDDRIAVASWKRLLRFEKVELDKIEEYIRKNTNKSPERFAK